tara:strand:+ start:5844 stop:6035 length:192 start_codon:yes stop_codon:yes gene_type:complete
MRAQLDRGGPLKAALMALDKNAQCFLASAKTHYKARIKLENKVTKQLLGPVLKRLNRLLERLA